MQKLTKAEYIEFAEGTLSSVFALIKRKNADYTGGMDDPFANFRISEDIGIDPFLGLVNRMSDKWQRVKSFCKTGNLQAEGIEDAFNDLIGYSLIALGMLHEKNRSQAVKDLRSEPSAAVVVEADRRQNILGRS